MMGRRSNAEKARLAAEEASQAAQNPHPEETESQRPFVDASKVDKAPDYREQVMEEILARRQTDAPKPEEAPKEEPKAEQPKETKDEPKAEEAKTDAPEAKAEPAKVKVKIDGEEIEVTQAEIDEAGGVPQFRMYRASENRLKRANDALAEANRLRAEMQEAAKRSVPQAPLKSDQEFLQDKMDVIRFGTPQESAQAMLEVINRRATDPNQIVVQATTNFNHEMALKKFRGDFQDIASNPVLSPLVQLFMQEALAPHIRNGAPDWSSLARLDWDSEYAKIGNKIRGAVPRQSQPQPSAETNGNPSPKSEKEDRKSSIVTLPTSSARAELPKEQKQESREDVLNDMRKSRGLPVG